MMVTDTSKRVIPFRPRDAKKIGDGCFYIDQIVWLNGDRIELGNRVGFNVGCFVNGFGGLVIGDDTIIGPNSMIHTANHETDPGRPIPEQGWRLQPVEIGPEVWIGMGVCVLPGVTIGEGAIVGAGAVVSRDIPPWSVAVGNPAKVIKNRKQ